MLVGANPDELDQTAGKFADSADKVKSLHGEALTMIRQSPWAGGDADHFEELWRTGARARLDEAAQLLHDAADALRRNAEEQRKASEADSDGFGSIPGKDGGPKLFGTAPGSTPGPGTLDPMSLLNLLLGNFNPVNQLGEVGYNLLNNDFLGTVFGFGAGAVEWGKNGMFDVARELGQAPILGSILRSGVFNDVMKFAGPLGGLVSGYNALHDFSDFRDSYDKTGWSVQTVEHLMDGTKDTAFGLTAFPTPATPILLTIGGGIALGETVYNLDPNWPSDAVHGARVISGAVSDTAQSVATDVANGAGTVWNDASSGAGAVVGFVGGLFGGDSNG